MNSIDLDDDKLQKIQYFQEVTQVDDFDVAQCTLASVDWNLERAVEAQISDAPAGPMEDQDDVVVVEPHEVRPISPELPFRVLPQRTARTRALEAFSDIGNVNIESRRNGDNVLPGSSSANGNSHSRNFEINNIARSSNNASTPVEVNDDSIYTDSADEDNDYDFNMAVEESRISRPGNPSVPLVPIDSGNVTEALNNFVSVFESRFAGTRGYAMPHFSTDPLDVALKEAFEAPGRGVEDRRPFAMYIHSDGSIAANIFAANVLCSDEVSSLLRGQFVLWPWDVTFQENKVKLIEWIYALGMDYVRQSLDSSLLKKENLPLLLVIIKEKGSYRVSQICFGMDTSQQVVEKLLMGIDEYSSIRVQEASELKEREERERIRQEQALEYEMSLAADRARIEAKELELKQQREEEEQRRIAEEEVQMRRAKLESELPDEPADGAPGSIIVRFRLPEGEQCQRRFRSSETLGILLKYLESKGYSTDKYRFFNSDFPKKDISGWDASASFTSLKWPLREQLFVEEQ